MSYQSNRQSMILPLGISAIDVLCCAMVASFVLFLVLSSQPVRERRAAANGKSSPSMKLRLTVFDPTTVLSLKLLPPQGGEEAVPVPVSLWTDEPVNARDTGPSPDRKPALQKGGGWAWFVFPRGGESLLVLERPLNGQWRADLSYAHGPSLEDVRVNVQVYGSCLFTSDVTLKPGETTHITDLGKNELCSAQKSLSLSF
jgi:hypothetical protein